MQTRRRVPARFNEAVPRKRLPHGCDAARRDDYISTFHCSQKHVNLKQCTNPSRRDIVLCRESPDTSTSHKNGTELLRVQNLHNNPTRRSNRAQLYHAFSTQALHSELNTSTSYRLSDLKRPAEPGRPSVRAPSFIRWCKHQPVHTIAHHIPICNASTIVSNPCSRLRAHPRDHVLEGISKSSAVGALILSTRLYA